MYSNYINKEEEYIVEPEDGLIRYEPKDIAEIRKIYDLDIKDNRDKVIGILNEWIQQQEHFNKKDYSKGYIERCILTSKGSIEKTKQQIEKMCTFRTLMPKYFQTTDLKNSEIMNIFDVAYFAVMPRLTTDKYRVVIVKYKRNTIIKSSYEYGLLLQLYCFMAEYLKNFDCCLGYILVGDVYDGNAAEILPKMNFSEVQQVLRILTEGYGCKIKGMYIVTGSKFIDGFLKILKALFSEKIRKRIGSVSTRKALRNILNTDVIPEEYGGTEKPVEQLCENLIRSLSKEPIQALMEEMSKGTTDESKRKTCQFNEEVMGMPGSFRTLSLD